MLSNIFILINIWIIALCYNFMQILQHNIFHLRLVAKHGILVIFSSFLWQNMQQVNVSCRNRNNMCWFTYHRFVCTSHLEIFMHGFLIRLIVPLFLSSALYWFNSISISLPDILFTDSMQNMIFTPCAYTHLASTPTQ